MSEHQLTKDKASDRPSLYKFYSQSTDNATQMAAKLVCSVPGCHKILPSAFCSGQIHMLCKYHRYQQFCPKCLDTNMLLPTDEELRVMQTCCLFLHECKLIDKKGNLLLPLMATEWSASFLVLSGMKMSKLKRIPILIYDTRELWWTFFSFKNCFPHNLKNVL